jgi:hypothetical protein
MVLTNVMCVNCDMSHTYLTTCTCLMCGWTCGHVSQIIIFNTFAKNSTMKLACCLSGNPGHVAADEATPLSSRLMQQQQYQEPENLSK